MSKFILESRYEDVHCKSNASRKASYSKKRKKKEHDALKCEYGSG